MASALIRQKQRPVRSGEKWRVFIQLQISATYVFGGGQAWDKRKQYNLYNPASYLRNIMFCKV